jgi:hypothetical protein
LLVREMISPLVYKGEVFRLPFQLIRQLVESGFQGFRFLRFRLHRLSAPFRVQG